MLDECAREMTRTELVTEITRLRAALEQGIGALKNARKIAWPWIDKNPGAPRLTYEEWAVIDDRAATTLAAMQAAMGREKEEG